MAKEMMIVFVYDTELLKSEEDDPASAILYFHPGWVSDQQRTSLCGQIIGTWHFLTNVFSGPQIFALQSGKFSIKMYGKYVLALGSDRNIADWILEHRMSTLTALINFFHNDLEKMSEIYQDTGSFSGKLYHMFETYLKIIMYGGHMFYNIPNLHLPKSASHVFLESIQLLQCCQQMHNVLGGVILYHNQVVASQLSSELTKRLVLTDPYRIKSPAEIVPVDFSIPLGVQLLQVYISYQDYQLLQDDASKVRSTAQYFNKLKTKKPSSKTVPVREPILSAMKRDQSLIFTTVPEEDADHSLLEKITKTKSPDRPKFLNLKSKTTDTKQVEPRTVPSTPFLGQTSICSTPMTELNKVVHQNIMSICVNPEETAVRENLDNSSKNFANVERVLSVNSESEKVDTCTCVLKSDNPYDKKRSSSMWELREKLKSANKRITMKYYNSRFLYNFEDEEVKVPKEMGYRTIGDPLYPIFKVSGQAVSHHLYNKCLEESLTFDFPENPKPEVFKSAESFLLFSPKKAKASPKKQQVDSTPKPKETRKALTLPLKSLSDQSDNLFSPSTRGRGVQLTPLMSKLSLLAMEEKSSGFCSRDTTPSEYKDPRFTPSQPNYSFLRRKSSVGEESKMKQGLRKAVLFVCGQQDMVMGMLLEEMACCDSEVVNSLFEKCTESLGKLERQLRHCLETYPGGNGQNESGEPYSYLCMDSQWDTVQRGGPWSNVDLGFLTHLHRDFININNVTEIILRNDDSIIYGNHCGNTEIFYQQVVSGTAGLPTPADPMGTVSLKAKRRLERDHAVILL